MPPVRWASNTLLRARAFSRKNVYATLRTTRGWPSLRLLQGWALSVLLRLSFFGSLIGDARDRELPRIRAARTRSDRVPALESRQMRFAPAATLEMGCGVIAGEASKCRSPCLSGALILTAWGTPRAHSSQKPEGWATHRSTCPVCAFSRT